MADSESQQNRGERDGEQLRKLFIGGIPSNFEEDQLRQHFEQWGELVDVVVMKDRASGRSRGFGFVTYKDEEGVDKAQANRPHTLDGKLVETKRAMPRGDSTRDESNIRAVKMFLGALKPETTEEELREYFSSYGQVENVDIAKDRESGKPRGFGFITFTDSDSVDKAILHKPHAVGTSQRIDCKKALSREQIAEIKAKQAMQYPGGGFAGGRGGFARGGFGGGGGYGGGISGGFDDGYGGGDFAAPGPMYDNGPGIDGGFGSYGGQGYGGGPGKISGGFGGGPQRFQPYGHGPPMRGAGGFRGGYRGRGGY